MADKKTFVLVHGAWWAGDWWWSGVAKELRARGHEVHTPTLTGVGPRCHLLNEDVGLETHTLDVVNLIKFEELDDICLVGHSYAGQVISQVAEHVPEGKISSIVYLDAFYLEDGQSLKDVTPPELAKLFWENEGPGVPPPLWIAGDDAEMHDLLERKGTPHPRKTQSDRISITGARDRVPRKTFVVATRNPANAVNPTAERLAAAPDWEVAEIDCGHMTMIEKPRETAEILLLAAGA